MVIAAFACQLPTAYMDAMTERQQPPLWMNLDYLSAEDWVIGCHGLPSVKYKSVQKFFSFPDFSRGRAACCVKAVCLSGVGNFSRMQLRSDNSCKTWASIEQRTHS